MTHSILPLVMSLLLSAPAALPLAAQQAQTPKTKKEKKVWTNEDLEDMRGTVRVSEIGPAGAGEQPAATETDQARANAERDARAKDVKQYSEQLATLRAEIERLDAEMRRLREFRKSAKGSMGGLVLGQEDAGITPEDALGQLAKRKREVQRQIDELEDQARRKSIGPGAIR
jgi:predicted RNase H-like nuclease (RuvC/YqgF family)